MFHWSWCLLLFVAGRRVFILSRMDDELYEIVKPVGLEAVLEALRDEPVGPRRLMLKSLGY